MPEIWLPYGDVEIPLEIKTENIDSVLELETHNKFAYSCRFWSRRQSQSKQSEY